MGDRWTDRLSDHIDGELGAAEERELAAHLAECPECTRLLAQLRSVVGALGSLPDVPPADDLWPGIEARLGTADAPGVLHLPAHRRRFSFSMPQLAAAGITLVVASSMVVWLVVTRTGSPGVAGAGAAVAVVTSPTTPDRAAPAASAALPGQREPATGAARPAGAERTTAGPSRLARATDAARAPGVGGGSRLVRARAGDALVDRQYNRAVADLESLLHSERSRLQPETIKAVEKSLGDIDRAIADARRALARDPADPYLNDHLAESMRAKLQLLRQTTALTQS